MKNKLLLTALFLSVICNAQFTFTINTNTSRKPISPNIYMELILL